MSLITNDESSTANGGCNRFHHAVVIFLRDFIFRIQTYPHSEEHMQQHDGGDRAEYLEKMEHSDPRFHVPPVNDASISSITRMLPVNHKGNELKYPLFLWIDKVVSME